MPIRDGRPVQDQFTLDRKGFEITGHASAVTDFTDREEVDRVYVGEVAEFVRSHTGADRVATLGWTLRRSAAPGENASQPQAALVHDDFSVAGARTRAGSAYASCFPDGPGFRRALITSLWRVFSPPPQDWPLALCDYASGAPGARPATAALTQPGTSWPRTSTCLCCASRRPSPASTQMAARHGRST